MQIPENDMQQKIEISISCRSLKDTDVFSKSDPQVIFKMKNPSNNKWFEIGRTEVIQNNLNPNFKKIFSVDYMFEQKQECIFEVIDVDGSGQFDHLGQCQTTLGAIIGSRNNTLILDLVDPKSQQKIKKSKIILLADKIIDCNDFIFTQWRGVKLMNTDGWFDKSDPVLRIKRIRTDGTFNQVHETEVIKDNLNPVWKPFELPCSRLDSGDHNKNIKVECWDWEKSGKFQFIGECQFTVQQLIEGKREFELTNPKHKHPGKLQLIQFNLIQRPSFLEYIRGNTQLNLMLAVDFTASNGAVSTPESLHYMNPNFLNAYQQAICSVGEILLDYDFDKKVPCFGFGGVPRFPQLTFPNAQHCFPMSGNQSNSDAFGIQQILNLYSYSLQHVSLSGPTYFNPILQETMKVAEGYKAQGSEVYTVMLILTDGDIHDMPQTIDSLVYASGLPLSVIIVGIGNADFVNMEKLDGDTIGLVNSQGQKATRDIVQFVPFRNFQGNGAALSKEVLAEVPKQLVSYMSNLGIKPKPAPVIVAAQIGMGESVQPVQHLAAGMNAFLAPHLQQFNNQPPSGPPPPNNGGQFVPQNNQQEFIPPQNNYLSQPNQQNTNMVSTQFQQPATYPQLPQQLQPPQQFPNQSQQQMNNTMTKSEYVKPPQQQYPSSSEQQNLSPQQPLQANQQQQFAPPFQQQQFAPQGFEQQPQGYPPQGMPQYPPQGNLGQYPPQGMPQYSPQGMSNSMAQQPQQNFGGAKAKFSFQSQRN